MRGRPTKHEGPESIPGPGKERSLDPPKAHVPGQRADLKAARLVGNLKAAESHEPPSFSILPLSGVVTRTTGRSGLRVSGACGIAGLGAGSLQGPCHMPTTRRVMLPSSILAIAS